MEFAVSDPTSIDRLAPPEGLPVGLDETQTPSDGQFVTKAVAGDRPAFDELIRRYQRQAVAVAYRLLGNNHDSLEVTQDAFLKAYKSLATLQKTRGVWRLVPADCVEPVAKLSAEPKAPESAPFGRSIGSRRIR